MIIDILNCNSQVNEILFLTPVKSPGHEENFRPYLFSFQTPLFIYRFLPDLKVK